MNDLLKKLNVLVKASLNDQSGSEKAPRLSKNVEGDIEALRGRINDAVQYEDEIKARIGKFQDEAVRWDAQADDAVQRGDDAGARYAIEQMRRAQQRAEMAEGDLREHERTTQELIQRVNVLDAVVADARRAQSAPAAAQPVEEKASAPAAVSSVEAKSSAPPPDLGGVLREARDKIAALADTAAAQLEQRSKIEQQQEQDEPVHSDDVNDDLENRRQRLSKR